MFAGYQYTNVIDIKSIKENGLKVLNSDTINLLIKEISKLKVFNVKILKDRVYEYINNVEEFDKRKGILYCLSDEKQLEWYSGTKDFLTYFGGEIFRNAVNSFDTDEKIKNIGIPVIIKFLFSFDDIESYKKIDFILHLKNKILNDKKTKFDMDIAIGKDIEPKNILGYYSLKLNKDELYEILGFNKI